MRPTKETSTHVAMPGQKVAIVRRSPATGNIIWRKVRVRVVHVSKKDNTQGLIDYNGGFAVVRRTPFGWVHEH